MAEDERGEEDEAQIYNRNFGLDICMYIIPGKTLGFGRKKRKTAKTIKKNQRKILPKRQAAFWMPDFKKFFQVYIINEKEINCYFDKTFICLA